MNWYKRQLYIEASRKMPDVGYREISQLMMDLGFEHIDTTGSHEKWANHQTGHVAHIPAALVWGSNQKNVAEYVLKQLGIPLKSFVKFWQHKKQRKNPSQFFDVNQMNPRSEEIIPPKQQPKKQDINFLEPDPNDPNDWRRWHQYAPNK